MEDYIEKIRKLPDQRLQSLIEGYRKTIGMLDEQYRMAIKTAMIPVADYTKLEIDKKQAELEAIEKMLAERH
jgi:hypothetical protein